MIEIVVQTHVVGVGIALGIAHAFEADHLAAMSSLATRVRGIRRTALIGAMWGMGHAVTLTLASAAFLYFHVYVNTKVSNTLETAVGVLLIYLGYDAFTKARSQHFHMHAHEHGDGMVHTHVHTHPHGGTRRHTSFLVGCFHGLAGSSALVILALSATQSFLEGMRFAVSFGLGSILGMAFFGACVGFLMKYIEGFTSLGRYVRIGAGIFCMLAGVLLVYHTLVSLI